MFKYSWINTVVRQTWPSQEDKNIETLTFLKFLHSCKLTNTNCDKSYEETIVSQTREQLHLFIFKS